jgi:ATP-dependent DNA ligase
LISSLIVFLVKIFDILFLNGVSLVAKTLRVRKGLMRKHVSEIHGRIEYVQEFVGKTAKDVRMRMDEIMENKLAHSFLVTQWLIEIWKG